MFDFRFQKFQIYVLESSRKEKETLVIFIQNGTENYEKVSLGRPKSRPWSGHGSDALSGPPVGSWRGGLFPTFRSLFEDFFGPLFDDFSKTTVLMTKV